MLDFLHNVNKLTDIDLAKDKKLLKHYIIIIKNQLAKCEHYDEVFYLTFLMLYNDQFSASGMYKNGKTFLKLNFIELNKQLKQFSKLA